MERVQFQQEQMLAELKDLVEKGLFAQKEVRQIMQKRTAFETALVRRVPNKADFLRYAAYEMDLEALRRKRAARIKSAPAPPSVSDYALVRRQFQIFERALRRFKGDVALWVQYIQIAKKEGARALVGRITARALQLHPNVPALYVLAAAHELRHLSPSAARALLQRGIRLNAESVDMWREYVRMELGFVESLRRRWAVLGIGAEGGTGTSANKGKGKNTEPDGLLGGEDAEHMDADDTAAQKEILGGAIVKSVISSAAQALPTLALFTALRDVLATHPSPPPLRAALLEHLFAQLRASPLAAEPAALKLAATRFLVPDLQGEGLIEALKAANEQLADAVRQPDSSEGVAAVYAEFIAEWCAKPIDDHLKGYLLASLHMHAQRPRTPASPALLAALLTLLTAVPAAHAHLPPRVGSPAGVVRLARACTARASGSGAVWRARLDAEAACGADADVVAGAWADARAAVVAGAEEEVVGVWTWGIDRAPPAEQLPLIETLLRESGRLGAPAAWRTVHEALLVRYVAAGAGAGEEGPAARMQRVRHLAAAYLPSARVWARVFAREAGAADAGDVLEAVCAQWRAQDAAGAAAALAGWLLRQGRGREGAGVIARAERGLGAEERAELQRGWRAMLDGVGDSEPGPVEVGR